MLNDRERVGADAFQLLIPLSKPKRLTLPFGPEEPSARQRDRRETQHEHHIMEIPLAAGGLGCALWDGGLVLARWIYRNGGVFSGRYCYQNNRLPSDSAVTAPPTGAPESITVLELGCGVGLAGIMAAHWASEVWLTDYIRETVRNAAYNVRVNSCDSDSSSSDDDSDADEDKGHRSDTHYHAHQELSGGTFSWKIDDRVHARLLDWDMEAAELGTAAAGCDGGGGGSGAVEDGAVCTAAVPYEFAIPPPGGQPLRKLLQPWFHCEDCWPKDDSKGCCAACASVCHAGHALVPQPPEVVRCDCFALEECRCLLPPPLIPQVDIIIGAELTYNLLSCRTLAKVMDKYLKPDGVVYEVLSNDRDGVGVFIQEIEALGFTTAKHPAPPEIVGNFGTRKWSKQNDETYSLYTWRRRIAHAEGGSDRGYRFPEMR